MASGAPEPRRGAGERWGHLPGRARDTLWSRVDQRAFQATLQANPWGLYEMHGNVWEWCADWYGAYPAGPVTDPEGPAGGVGRVLRGGSWNNSGRYVRSAYRNHWEPGLRYVNAGFRLARGPELQRAGQAGSGSGQPEPVASGASAGAGGWQLAYRSQFRVRRPRGRSVSTSRCPG